MRTFHLLHSFKHHPLETVLHMMMATVDYVNRLDVARPHQLKDLSLPRTEAKVLAATFNTR